MNIRLTITVIVTGLIIALGVGLAVTAVQQLNEAAGLQRNGVRAMATVSQKWIVAGESKDKSHLIRYAFQLNDRDLTFERAVPVALHRVVYSGSTFEVNVDTDNPDLHEIFPGQLAGTARSKLTAGLFIAGVGILLFLFLGGLDMFKRKPKRRDV